MASSVKGGSKRAFAVLAKNLHAGNIKTIESTDLYNVTDDFQYWPFHPKDLQDFIPRREYGRIEGKMMCRYYILRMAEDHAQLSADVASKKVVVPKRLSHGPTQHPLREYRKIAETDGVTKKKDQGLAKREAQKKKREDGDEVLARQVKVLKATATSQILSSKGSQTDPTELVATSCSTCADVLKQNELMTHELELLRTRNSEVEEELRENKARIKEFERTTSSTLQKIAKLPELIEKSRVKGGSCLPSKLGNCAVRKIEDAYAEIEIPPDMVYVGCGKLLPVSSLEEAEEETTLGKRVAFLCDLYWPDAVHTKTLSGKLKNKTISVSKITDTEVSSMKNILKAMYWEDDRTVMEKQVRRLISHYTDSVRAVYLDKHFPDREREKKNLKRRGLLLKKMMLKICP